MKTFLGFLIGVLLASIMFFNIVLHNELLLETKSFDFILAIKPQYTEITLNSELCSFEYVFKK